MRYMKDDFERARLHLAKRVARWTSADHQHATLIPGLSLYQHMEAVGPMSCMLEPVIAMPVQGIKQAILGSEVYAFDRHRFLITSLDLPVVIRVENATPDSPFLGVVLALDPVVIGQLITETNFRPSVRQATAERSMVLGDTTAELLAAFDGLVGLLDEPELIPVVSPLIQREIFYRVLKSDSGNYLWRMASAASQSQRISRAIEWLKSNFREPLQIKELATQVDMSPSRFHHHFRRLTSMSPLQVQKWLRLTEARRLMAVQGIDAATAAYDVGYGSSTQFSREYVRQFGNSPRRDVEHLLRQASPISAPSHADPATNRAVG
jgi:AraC-like DNA-binding protein